MLSRICIIFIVLLSFSTKAQVDTTAQSQPKSKTDNTTPPALGEVFKPKISLGVGMLSFHGDLYAKHFQAPWTARIGYDLNISQRLFKPLQLNFNILFGQLGANEWLNNRQENFQSEIRAGGVSLMYDFGNFLSDKNKIRPWVSVGVNSFEFLSKTDLFDKNGNRYYYWSDGSIKNIDESAPTASLAVNLNRDYLYETDIRELNKDGFGKYPERAWAFPIGFGALMQVTDRFDFKIGMQYYLTTTDYIDGITKNSLGTRTGTKQRDNFVYTSFALQYDLVITKKSKIDTLPDNYFDGIDWLAIDNDDYDKDGVRDWDDKCHGTPAGVKVDQFGCPFDDDADGVANHADKELESPKGVEVNSDGVALTDDYWQDWYNHYMDSGNVVKQEVVENFYAMQKDSAGVSKPNTNQSKNDKVYTVELARYNGPVPNDEMAYLLSIGDIQSTMLSDNTTVLYTAGTYKDIQNAVKRRDEFRAEGNKKAQVGYFDKNGDLVSLSDEEINKVINDSKNNQSNAPGDVVIILVDDLKEEFAKGDIVYRVQLGAYRNRISRQVFKNVGSVVELKSDNGVFTYATKGFKTIQGAADLRADLVLEGYSDAFITAYKDGKRIPLSSTKATMETNETENINEIPNFSSVDKSLVSFKVQLGALRKASSNDMEDKTKDLKDIEKQVTSTGMVRYMSGSYTDFSKADAHRQELNDLGFAEAFVIAVFKGEVISIQEALELLK